MLAAADAGACFLQFMNQITEQRFAQKHELRDNDQDTRSGGGYGLNLSVMMIHGAVLAEFFFFFFSTGCHTFLENLGPKLMRKMNTGMCIGVIRTT